MRVVGDDAEARVGCVFLHDAPQRHLRGRRHGVGFVEDDELVRAERLKVAWFGDRREDLFRACLKMAGLSVSSFSTGVSLGQGVKREGCVLAKVLICSRTTSMPRSSLALSSRTICRMFLLPYILLASARMVDVLPVPGGP